MTRQSRWKKKNPWHRYVEWARRRCNDDNPEGPNYAHYRSKGIVCILTGEQVRFMYERDGAAKMKKPSLDRIDSRLGYSFENCRFIEFALNSRRAWDKTAGPEPDTRAEFV